MSSPSYIYTQLADSATEIRLVTLFPSPSYDDPILISIGHHPLIEPTATPAPKKPTLEEVRETLRQDWAVHETFDDRFIFRRRETNFTSWTHPSDPCPPCLSPGLHQMTSSQTTTEHITVPRYEALSYTWESPMDKVEIFVSNKDNSRFSSGYLQIGKNLDCALRHLRLSDKPRALWADAICINQNDREERSRQVNRMGSIFSLAERVVVWLGPSSSSSLLALSTLDDLGRRVVVTKDTFSLPSPDMERGTPCWAGTESMLPYDVATWQALRNLLRRPWFQRMWVLQEVQLGNHRSILRCGSHCIPWQRFRHASVCLASNNHISQDLHPILQHHWAMCNSLVGVPLDRLFLWTTNRECSDAKDRIYGILSITPSWLREELVPDYSLSLQDVYKATLLIDSRNTKRLDLLPFARGCDRMMTSQGWSTWVPDFRGRRTLCGALKEGGNFRASSFAAAEIRELSMNRIQLPGVIVDRICQFGPLGQISSISGMRQFLKSKEMDTLHTCSYPMGGNLFDAYCTTFAVGCLKDWTLHSNYLTLKDWTQRILGGSPGTEWQLGQVLGSLEECNLFETETGYFGVAEGRIAIGKLSGSTHSLLAFPTASCLLAC